MNVPVLVGIVPLTAVKSFVLDEGYKTAAIASSKFTQLIAPTTKTIKIEALLIGKDRAWRTFLEGLALTSRAFASAAGPLTKFIGIPVVAKNGVHLDMQITTLTFTQDNTNRDTLSLSMTLVNVPRRRVTGVVSASLDLVVAVGAPLI